MISKWLLASLFTLTFCSTVSAQNETKQMVRLAKLVIYSAQLESYHLILKEEIQKSISLEPGVFTLYAVAEKERPTHITILEIYANVEASKSIFRLRIF